MYSFGVILAREGSKRFPGKHLRVLGGLSLIGHAIRSARESKLLSRTIVTTDSPEIAGEARRHGAEVPFLRPAWLATDEIGPVPVLQHAVRWLEETAGIRPDLIVRLQPTSPFRTGAHIDATIQKVIETGADSAQTVVGACYPPFYMMRLEGDRTVPLFIDGHKYVRHQDTPPVYQPNGAVYVTRYAVLMERNRALGDDNRAVVMEYEVSINIDTEWDLKMAELIVQAGLAPWERIP